MFYLPSARRFILPALVLLIVLALAHLVLQQSWPSRTFLLEAAVRSQIKAGIPIAALSSGENDLYDLHQGGRSHAPSTPLPQAHPRTNDFLKCHTRGNLNPITSHIRLPNKMYNITMKPPSDPEIRSFRFFNPAIIPLPHWTEAAKYVVVSRLVTSGHHQESHICLADICSPLPPKNHPPPPADTRACTDADISVLGPHGGIRCVSAPVRLDIPSTPAKSCPEAWLAFPDIPGFHDPRIFWSGKGEPLILVNSASQYGCVGLWVVDLRKLFPDLGVVLKRGIGSVLDAAKPMSYEYLTEITRNPGSDRSLIEKNWMLWFPSREEAYVQFDLLGHAGSSTTDIKQGFGSDNTTGEMSHMLYKHRFKSTERKGGRTFAKLIGHGLTTPNLTSPLEQSCFNEHSTPVGHQNKRKSNFFLRSDHTSVYINHTHDSFGQPGHWHQGSNSLRLILCTRAEVQRGVCDESSSVKEGRSVHFAVVHRKFSNAMDLPLRYERYVVVWEGRKPFRILGVSRWPMVWRDEWVRPWTWEENFGPGSEGYNNENSTVLANDDDDFRPHAKRQNIFQHDHEQDFEYSTTASNPSHDETGYRHHSYPSSLSAYFTYTPSLAWSWMPHSSSPNARRDSHRHSDDTQHDPKTSFETDNGDDDEYDDDDSSHLSRLGIGYLGDDVLVGIGLDDVNQAFVRVRVDDLLSCLRLCPGVSVAQADSA